MDEVEREFILETYKTFRGLKSTAEKAFAQISNNEFHISSDEESNSVAVIMQHLSGNMVSRFTDFFLSDGEKPDRNRDSEFIDGKKNHDLLIDQWNKAWQILFSLLETIQPADLMRIVTIRNEEHTVIRALQRQLSHYAYHVGQIVYICKQIKTINFKTLSIARGESGKFVIQTPPSNNKH